MVGSFEKIDYALRPAKHTERRMFCDIFRKLNAFYPLREYVYVGFGAVGFYDFVLFHKALGVRRMVSIEVTASAIQRVQDNKPFDSIVVRLGLSEKVLPGLDWKDPHIVWLDYDNALSTGMMLDVDTVAGKARSGSALAITFQCNEANEARAARKAPAKNTAMQLFENTFGKTAIPTGTDEGNLYGWPFAELGRRMLLARIEEALAKRNSLLSPPDHVTFRLLSSINYQDGAKMASFIGVFCSAKDGDKFANCRFESLEFLEQAGTLTIEVPKLTLAEIRRLERQLPLRLGGALKPGSIPQEDADRFAKFYRYLPNFAVLEN